MSIGKLLVERLRQLAGGDRSALADEHTLRVSGQPVDATLEFFDHDRYSVTLRQLAVGSDGPAPADARAYLSTTAAEVARRLGFLEEPLAVWELDGGERVAQLRSSPPLREGEEVSYWEVTLSAGERPNAQAIRYRWAPGMVERETLAYPATFALVGRIADALADALEVER